MTHTLPLPTLEATSALAGWLAPLLQAGDVIALEGGLGTGKTTFCRALISALMHQETNVPSPTYTLVQTYDGPDFPIFHFDLYRLEDPQELEELGWRETADGLTLIEWPIRAGPFLPAWRLDIVFNMDNDSREAVLVPHGEEWQARLHEL